MEGNKVFKGYYLIILGSFILVLLTAALLAYLQFQNRFQFEKSLIRRQVQENAAQLNTIVKSVRNNLHALRGEAEYFLNYPEFAQKNPLFSYLTDNSSGDYFHLDNVPDSLKSMIGNLTGYGRMDSLSEQNIRDIHLSLNLNQIHQSSFENIPNAILSYSSLDDRFINVHPFIPSKDFHVNKEIFQTFQVTYDDVYPDKNPKRSAIWTEAYIDETGQGLMVTAVIPFYQRDQMMGLGGIDLTLDSLNAIINQSQREIGEIFLINNKNQLLAHPKLIASSQAKITKADSAFPASFENLDAITKDLNPKMLHQVNNYFVYYENVRDTPWKLFYTVSVWETYVSIFFDIGINTLFIMVAISLVLFVSAWYTRRRFILPAQELVRHIQRENQNKGLSNYRPPEIWQHWFNVITSIFQKNRDLIGELKENNEMLEQKVSERTQEIAAQNEELIQNQEEITSQRDYIERKNQELETRNRQIRSSINAAFSIQNAILPPPELLQKVLGEHFIIYKPKDIVSGDFYWVHEFEKKRILATVDCTGHGVPGALMSMIGNTILEKVISMGGQIHPSRILEEVHLEVGRALKQDTTQNNNGMDMTILCLEDEGEKASRVLFAGAKTSLFYCHSQEAEVIELKGSRRSIGGFQNTQIPFDTHELLLEKGSLVYLGSDGLVDQNNVKRKRFGEKAFMKLLSQNVHHSLQDQRLVLMEALNKHMEGTQQRDDILTLGFKI